MACRDGGYTQAQELQQEIDHLTKMLCGAMKELHQTQMKAKGAFYPEAEVLNSVSGLKDWWFKHQQEDKLREGREAAVNIKEQALQSALTKLTAQEAQILGLIKQ